MCPVARVARPGGEFARQVAVVTGAARGLGAAVAGLLVERGATVWLADRDGDALAATVERLDAIGAGASAFPCDVTDEKALRLLRARLLERDGQIDVVVNNAGGWRHARAAEIESVDWNWTFDVNLKSVLLVSRTFMGDMAERGYGRIVNIASHDAHQAKPSLPHYAAAKAGVVSLTRSLARELAPKGVLVNAVSPGPILTERTKDAPWLAAHEKASPIGRAAMPEDIAEVVLFLASPRNRIVNGAAVIADGGMVMV